MRPAGRVFETPVLTRISSAKQKLFYESTKLFHNLETELAVSANIEKHV